MAHAAAGGKDRHNKVSGKSGIVDCISLDQIDFHLFDGMPMRMLFFFSSQVLTGDLNRDSGFISPLLDTSENDCDESN